MYKLLINLKAYKEGSGTNILKFAQIVNELSVEAKKKNVDLILCVNSLDLRSLLGTGVHVYAQHIDAYDYGAHTGFLVPELVKSSGVLGSLVNHSEHRIDFDLVGSIVSASKKVGLEMCVCVKDDNEVKKVLKYNPDFIAVEPSELIGGDISISTARPELISNSVKVSKGIPILVGAGVKNAQDVKKAVELGAKGILVASGVVKANDPKAAILDLISGF
ncbi:MAG: triosephosphate isomerase [Nanoarchaeota archaeon]|nr:triosephosphate isomerase [Nanoarchaeota archaeon]